MTNDDRTVQVPVSRIRDTVDSAMQKHAFGILLPLQDQEFTAVVEDVTAAVADLLSQPTPTAEPPSIAELDRVALDIENGINPSTIRDVQEPK